jgi:fused signal recognition particle receptor
MFGFVKKLKKKLAKTKNNFIGKIAEAINLRGKVDEELMEQLEEILIQSDIGVDQSIDIIDKLREEIRFNQITETEIVRQSLEKIMSDMLIQDYADAKVFNINKSPFIILFIGVNGVGKTTTIGKLAKRFKNEGKSVLMIAADTFRAAAIEQLVIWAERADVDIMKQQHGSDPSSVVFDGLNMAKKRGYDVVLIDTAGRQHNRTNLMNELGKIDRTIKKIFPEGADETLLVIDATTGQNAVSQAKTFNETIKLSGLVLTKLDGTSKGGIIFGIKHKLGIPVKLIGIGEQVEDLQDFNAQEFTKAIFEK